MGALKLSNRNLINQHDAGPKQKRNACSEKSPFKKFLCRIFLSVVHQRRTRDHKKNRNGKMKHRLSKASKKTTLYSRQKQRPSRCSAWQQLRSRQRYSENQYREAFCRYPFDSKWVPYCFLSPWRMLFYLFFRAPSTTDCGLITASLDTEVSRD